MNIAEQIWQDGSLISHKEATVSVLSHSFNWGTAVFEELRFYETDRGPSVFRLNDHVERFFRSAESIQLPLKRTEAELSSAIFDTIRANNLSSGFIRLAAYFGVGDMEVHPVRAPTHILILVSPWISQLGNQSITATIPSIWRIPPQCTVMDTHFLGSYGNLVVARQEARRKGFQEALLIDYEGNIADSPSGNFFAIRSGVLFTTTVSNVYPSMTRDTLLTIADELKLKTRVTTIAPTQLSQFEEAFLTTTAHGIVPLANVDQSRFQHTFGPTTRKLKELYNDVVHGKLHAYDRWQHLIPQEVPYDSFPVS